MENIGVIRKGTINNRTLDFDNKPICRATANTNELGTYIVGNKLYDNGRLVAVSSQENPQLIITDIVKFGEVRLDTDGICINITLENYNKLYNREEVPGYKYFDPYDVYNIVTDVNSPIITYTRDGDNLLFVDPHDNNTVIEWPNNKYVLYNNVVGEEEVYYEEDFKETVKQWNAPYLAPRYFNPRIYSGDTIKIPFSVDNYYAEYVQGRTINGVCKQKVTGPYTIELRIEDDDSTLVRKTVYAGESIIETPEFENVGESWFTIRCIDSNGVCSAVHYMEVWVQDPNYVENLWQVSDSYLTSKGIVYDDDFDGVNDPEYPGEAIGVPIEDLTPAVKAKLDAWNDFVVQAYKNKIALTELFEDALDPNKSGGIYNGIKLPTHRYNICDYTKISGTDAQPVLNNDTPKYYYCELEYVYEDNKVVGNKIKEVAVVENGNTTNQSTLETYTENEIIEDVKSLFRTTNDATVVDYNKLKTYRPWGYVYVNGVKTFKALDTIASNTVNIYNKDRALYKPGKYYFAIRSNAIYGDPLTCPSDFTLDLNNSLINVLKQYDFSPTTQEPQNSSLELNGKDRVHIKNGRFKFGIVGYDWIRCCMRIAYTNPMEHVTPIILRGNHFCSFTDITFEGALGYGISGNVQARKTWILSAGNKSFTPWNYQSSTPDLGSGIYDNKRLTYTKDNNVSLGDCGILTEGYNGVETYVMGDTSITYGAASTDEEIGYIPINLTNDTNDTKYIFVGYTGNGVSGKGKRHELFIFFYTDIVENNTTRTELIKVVKTTGNWMVRVPEDATKLRIMGYGHSGKGGVSDASNIKYLGVYPARSSYGTEYRRCVIKEARAAFVCGNERQVLYDDFTFIDVSSPEVYKPTGIGTWDAMTPHCIDLESGAPTGKYITFNNIKAIITEGRSGTRSICLQNGEFVQLTNSDMIYNDWGLKSGLISNNTFKNLSYDDKSRCVHIRPYYRSGVLFHKHINYIDNFIQSRVNDGSFNIWYDLQDDLTQNEQVYEDVAETQVVFRGTTCIGWEKPALNYLHKIIWRNSKRINRAVEAGRKLAPDIYID